MGELYSDLGLLDDMIKALGRKRAMDPKTLAKAIGHSEEAVLEQLTQSNYFEPASTKVDTGKYILSEDGHDRLDKIS